ncbi:MAG: Flp family type IVb pilin [Actinomycetota bacterium]|nr:Flp family type IVb pilin [Actinomycetota bacterium]
MRAVASANDFRTREEGATAVEYGMMVALIAAVIVGVVGILGGQVNEAFQTISDALTGE